MALSKAQTWELYKELHEKLERMGEFTESQIGFYNQNSAEEHGESSAVMAVRKVRFVLAVHKDNKPKIKFLTCAIFRDLVFVMLNTSSHFDYELHNIVRISDSQISASSGKLS